MWVARELSRLLFRVAVAVLVASLIAEVRALVSGGDFFHTWRITLLLLGCLMLLLAGSGARSTGSARRVNWGVITPGRGGILSRPVFAGVEGPQLTASAVFFASALALFALGIFA
ncbi:MAG TPA: hypothetical protein VGK69_12030 [Gaiellaceae bacterium]